jgi:hypothetical protein
MNGTTFPDFHDEELGGTYDPGRQPKYSEQDRQRNYQQGSGGSNYQNQQGGGRGNYQSNGGNGGNWEKKPWQGNNNGGNWEKKPWQGNSNGGGGKFQRKEEPLDPTIYFPCAVSGNKEAPQEVLSRIADLVRLCNEKEITVRTGCEGPVELAADDAATGRRERILPWRDFQEKESKLTFNSERAHAIAKKFHPTYDNMKRGIQHILAKNARLILGDKMTSPARFLLTWTEDGIEHARDKTSRTGLAGHIISIATAAGVPIYNLGNPTAEQRLREYLSQF